VLRDGMRDIIANLPDEAYFASLLDPRFLDTYIPTNLRGQWWARLDQLVAVEHDRLHPQELAAPPQEHEPPQPPPPDPPPAGRGRAATRAHPQPPIPKKSYEDLVREKREKKVAQRAAATPYRDLVPVNEKSSVGAWWLQNQKVYPEYAVLARRYLAIPATSAPCERLFSTGGRVIEKRRAALKPNTARAIILVHEHIDRVQDVVFDAFLYDD
jgi:hypothetical protein